MEKVFSAIDFNPARLIPSNPEVEYKKLSGKKILLIEDDYVNYLYLSELFTLHGAIVFRAVSIEQAINRLHLFEQIDLIITNNSITCDAQNEMVKYLFESTSVPVVMLVGKGGGFSEIQEQYPWIKYLVSIEYDSRYLCELVSDALTITDD